MTRAESSRAHWGPMTSRALGCVSWRSAQAAIMGPRLSCCTSLRQRSQAYQSSSRHRAHHTSVLGSRALQGFNIPDSWCASALWEANIQLPVDSHQRQSRGEALQMGQIASWGSAPQLGCGVHALQDDLGQDVCGRARQAP